MAGLLWERRKLDTSVISGTGRRGDKDQQGSRSAVSAAPPLPQEPVGPNLAFALEKIERGGWSGDGTPTGEVSHGSGLGSPWDLRVLLYLHFHIPSELQLETIELLQHSLGLRRQVDLEGWRGQGRKVRKARVGAAGCKQREHGLQGCVAWRDAWRLLPLAQEAPDDPVECDYPAYTHIHNTHMCSPREQEELFTAELSLWPFQALFTSLLR